MKQMKRFLSVLLCAAMLFALGFSASADEGGSDSSKPYLVLGADLSDSQRATVLDLLGVENPDTYLQDYNVYYTTNDEEYEYLGSYLDSSVIGNKALSSILLTPGEEGSGIHITTQNINYCTVSMYQNALITAGVSDVDLKVAGPANISGTAALVSSMKAYEIMTGKTLSDDSVDAATNELVLTGEVGDEIGDKDTAAELIAAVKNEVFANGTDVTEQDINDAIDEVCKEMNITLDDDLRQQIIDLIEKISKTNFDVDALAEQASDLFNKVSGIVDRLSSSGVDAGNFFTRLVNSIISFFQNLFG